MYEVLMTYPLFGVLYIYLNWHHIAWRKPHWFQVFILGLLWPLLLSAQLIYEVYFISRQIIRYIKRWIHRV